ncbi:hypothetical protein FCL69_02730 [Mycoplasma bovis]|nr:hypothetical protein [Mycoplasmopsis bovis]
MLSAQKLLKGIEELKNITLADIDDKIETEKESSEKDVFKKVTIKAGSTSKLISGTLVIEKKDK